MRSFQIRPRKGACASRRFSFAGLPLGTGESGFFQNSFSQKLYKRTGRPRTGAFCWFYRSAGPEGEGGCFDSPLCPLALSRFLRRAAAGACKNRSAAPAVPSLLRPLDALGAAALWTPYPPATTRAEPWTQKQKVAPGVWLKKLFTARQKYCASLFPDAIRPALRFVCAPFGRACTQPGEPKKN